MKLSAFVIVGALALGLPGVASAQRKGQAERDKPAIPVSERPPAGMCRIWLDNVPAAQQPAPTDCASAVRNRPPKGRVIFGDDYVGSKKKNDTTGKGTPAIKGFAPGDKKRPPIIRIP